MELHVQIDRAEALRRGFPTSSESVTLLIQAAELEALPSEDRELLASRLQANGGIAPRWHFDGKLQERSRIRIAEPTLAGVLERIREEDAAAAAHAAERDEEQMRREERHLHECIDVLRDRKWRDDRGMPDWPASGGVGTARAQEIREEAISEVSGAGDWIASELERMAREKAEREAAAAREAAEAAAAKQADAEERQRWIEAHGSERLRRAAAEGIEHGAIYRDERLELERPGWRWFDRVAGELDDPRNPPAEAFAVLDQARKADPAAKLKWYAIEHEHSEDCYDIPDCPPYELTAYVAEGEFLGRRIVFGATA